ncbi:hypothetical protein [Allopontixanthobacter sp.]|uniref:hypothetical protein n=1 Tax=Allopontixanthobacter sp. TaxID=2906452 RepID=UPI002ABB59CF|nr:hypothetical protein [Allopontixanthobacter sp.]MDZ4307362.1 hypothetical protein [Allopontixanthobacter sp.]
MQGDFSIKRLGAGAFAAVMAMLLTGCLLSPGKFTSQLDLRNGGAFAYSYSGEIYLLALSKLAEMGNKAELSDQEFIEQPCYSDEEFEERTCTADEIAVQKREWQADRDQRIKSQKKDAEMMSAMLGGIDPADPGAAEELANRLRRQKGWKAVEYKGGGLFLVEFRIEGRLDHDFQFPTIEGFSMSNFFVLVANREGGTVRVDAPGFSAQSGGNAFHSIMAGMAGVVSRRETGGEDGMPKVPELDGTFRIVTDGEVLANNTDEGPVDTTAGKVLEWSINKRTQTAPTALIRLAP